MRIGLFGGTFDPPHRGHVALARAAVRELALERLYVVPAGRSPFKDGGTPVRHRLALSRLAFGGLPRTVVSPWEALRPPPSYTVDTLKVFRRRHPRGEWFLLVGGDSWRDFRRWRRWRDILRLSRLVVGRRAGVPVPGRVPARILKATIPRVSSTAVRSGDRRFIPAAVQSYIRRHHLYS